MGILHHAIEYVKDAQSGKEGFMTRYEQFYPYLPRPARCMTSVKALYRHDSGVIGQSIGRDVEGLKNDNRSV